jgi:tetratricopeptide (TPR) repeat protein/4-amino-4-deoxy-L-arabinose transferase-like glycosyltransferase
MAFNLTPVRRNILLTLVVIAGAYLRLSNLGWGLPEVFEEATPWRQAWEMWGGASGKLDFNPHFFNYPAFSFYIQWIGQAIVYIAGRATGEFSTVADMQASFESDPGRFILVGRFITTLFGIASIYLVYRVGRAVFSQAAGLIAALFLAFNFSHIRRGQFIATDVPLLFFVLLAFYFIYRIATDGSRRHYLWAGVCVGLAAGVKYPGFLTAAGVVAAHIYRHLRLRHGWRVTVSDAYIWMCGALALLVFFTVSPYCFVDYAGFLKDFRFERAHMKIGHFGAPEQAVSYHRYLISIFPAVLTVPIAILAVLGVVLGLVKHRGLTVFLLAFPLVYFAVVGSWKTAADHYMFPVLPFLLIYAAFFLVSVFEKIPSPRKGLLLGVASCIILIPSVLEVHSFYARQDTPDNRTVAREWIRANLDRGAGIVKEEYTPDLDPREYAVFELPLSSLYPKSTTPFYDLRWYVDFDYVLISNEVYRRYRNEPAEYPAHERFYRNLESHCELVQEFDDRSGSGPHIKVYRMAEAVRQMRDEAIPPDMTQSVLMSSERHANAKLLVNLGNAVVRTGNTSRAAHLFRLAVGVDPTLSKGWYNLGLTLGNAGEFEECENAFRRAVQLDPAYDRAWFSLGELYRQTARPEQAIQAYEEGLKHSPRRPDVMLVLGGLHLDRGDRDAALEYARRAERLGYDASPLLEKLE